MIGGDDENRGGGGLAKLGDVIGVAVENGAADGGGGCGSGNLRQGGAADRLKNDGVGALRLFGLDGFQKLRALRDGVVVGIDRLELDAELAGSRLSRPHLLDLVIVFV